MKWLGTIATFVTIAIVVEIVGWMIAPAFRPLSKLYKPPHGKFALALTWLAAVAALWSGLRSNASQLSALLMVTAVPVAIVASFIYRDKDREARGLAPIVARAPQRPLPKWLKETLNVQERDTPP